VICGKCSTKKAHLAYIDNHEKRVCDPCFTKLETLGQGVLQDISSLVVESVRKLSLTTLGIGVESTGRCGPTKLKVLSFNTNLDDFF